MNIGYSLDYESMRRRDIVEKLELCHRYVNAMIIV